jgi:hypothetical protein
MSDQKDVVEIMRKALEAIRDLEMGRGDGVVGDYIEDVRELASSALKEAEATITRVSHGVRHRQEPFTSK